MKAHYLLPLLLIITSPVFAVDDSLRCGSKIVRVGMNIDEVRKACGKPSSSTIEEHDVRSGGRVVGKTQLHIWHYNRGSGQRTAVLKFDQDKLLAIDFVSK